MYNKLASLIALDVFFFSNILHIFDKQYTPLCDLESPSNFFTWMVTPELFQKLECNCSIVLNIRRGFLKYLKFSHFPGTNIEFRNGKNALAI